MSAFASFGAWAQRNRWIWAAIGVLILWLVLSVVTNRFSLSSLSGVMLSASFLTVVGIGQMFVVTTGRGNIDLSVASVITLSAFVALLTVKGQDANLAIGVIAAVVLGLAV
ncbi:MAG: ABC transporter permease, partial [Mesorhizobium sp.]